MCKLKKLTSYYHKCLMSQLKLSLLGRFQYAQIRDNKSARIKRDYLVLVTGRTLLYRLLKKDTVHWATGPCNFSAFLT